MLLVLSKACCYPWSPLLLHYIHDCTTLSFSRVNDTMIKPIPFSLMEKNHDMYHSWMRNSHSGLTCLHLLEVREQPGSTPVCSNGAHIHLSGSQPETPKGAAQTFALQLPSETFPHFERWDTCKSVLMFTHAYIQPNTISQSRAIPGNSLKKLVICKSYKKLWMEVRISSESRRWDNWRYKLKNKEPGLYRLTIKCYPINLTF